ncbi:HDOD domain-containing protein [Nocardioides sp.]|uniref:EAL and HDOD domain-containing protein n=1 Tax=Nocardioides sp. TaxID=35761 RepID=UPI001A2C2EF2|nr:HDOD domain-containing protein [Nocardioides sp.]MBJ7357460.1 HDOD domain-containing protein [Nocardioides sp.]
MAEHEESSGAAPAAVDRVVARQPIVGLEHEIVAFQLVNRPAPEVGRSTSHGAGAGETLTMSAVLGDLTVDLSQLVGDVRVFCAAGPEVLADSTVVTAPSGRTVLMVPAELGADPAVVERCRLLVQEGYSIAVDRLDRVPGAEALLALADVAVIDLQQCPRPRAEELVARCRVLGVTAMAARCPSEDDLTWAAAAGFELFHGPAVQRPVEVNGRTLAPSALAQVQLASELLDERLDFGRVEAILAHEPALVVQVLHLASLGAAGGLRRDVHSVREALVLLGTVRIRQWAAITVLGQQVSRVSSDALAVALVRARMCELLAQPRGLDRGFAFTAGLLSTLDLLLGVELTEVEKRVDVGSAMAAAAFRRETPLGELVGLVRDYQDAVDEGEPAPAGLSDVELVAAMAFCWATAHISAMERTLQPS